jgi:hypothetical protein
VAEKAAEEKEEQYRELQFLFSILPLSFSLSPVKHSLINCRSAASPDKVYLRLMSEITLGTLTFLTLCIM